MSRGRMNIPSWKSASGAERIRKIDSDVRDQRPLRLVDRVPFKMEAIALLLGLGGWYLLTDILVIFPFKFLPTPNEQLIGTWELLSRTGSEHSTYGPHIMIHALYTLERLLAGYIPALAIGFGFGLLMGWRQWFDELTLPYVEFLRPVPAISFIPLSILWFGFSDVQKIFLVFLGGVWPILMNTREGINGVGRDVIRAGLMLGMDQRQLLLKVMVPAALPSILTGARIGVGTASLAVFGAELVGATNGLGWVIIRAEQLLRTEDVITGMMAIGTVGLILSWIFQRAEWSALKWHRDIRADARPVYGNRSNRGTRITRPNSGRRR